MKNFYKAGFQVGFPYHMRFLFRCKVRGSHWEILWGSR